MSPLNFDRSVGLISATTYAMICKMISGGIIARFWQRSPWAREMYARTRSCDVQLTSIAMISATQSRLPRAASSSIPPMAPSLKRKASDEAIGSAAKVQAIAAQGAAGPSRIVKPLPASRPLSRNGTRPGAKVGLGRPNLPSTAGPRRITRSASGPPAIRPTNARPAASGIVNGQKMVIDTKGKGPHGKSIAALRKGGALTDAVNQLEVENELNAERSKAADLQTFQTGLQCELAAAKSQELETRRAYLLASDEIDSLKKQHARSMEDITATLATRDREIKELNEDLTTLQEELSKEREGRIEKQRLQNEVVLLETQITALKQRGYTLQGEAEGLAADKVSLKQELETLRKLVVQRDEELRDIYVAHEQESPDGLAQLSFPDKDKQEIVVTSKSESATGATREAVMPFTFDRVFAPGSTQHDVFEEISLLAQSCVDGYNVCIFAYGQTGSGKSFTMEGGETEETRGMIPRAVQQMFRVTEDLKPRGWEYKMEGQFLEIYNETINDLLGTGEIDKKKHEIKHEKGGKTTVTDVVVIPLTSPIQVLALLQRAHKRRTVAATLMNERSSRSHSVFTLRVTGHNTHTGESCSGTLNLVDLAGSERLSSSGAANHKDRLKETQAINKSLSALGDVIAALGNNGGGGEKGHIPYRNSKLTYLLQNSLSGNSKTLMMMNMSPLAAHLSESLCSLRFATKVNNTNLGVAKKLIQARPA
ncbi:kinesin family protein (KlpA), putative [Rhizoctonia solani AG-1 IA]|uniref:Kinesin-like protein n=1 Tax=Thanatephorus cucumeris (strain AG1-IA) TaxID=983506 RepID=L8X3G2_THACA|nr:kinesin family protein (KlpA), putative [Rhizoctonia solani AG-1 IA]